MKRYLEMLKDKHYAKLAALQSAGMAPVVNAIRDGCPGLAEALLMDLEADHTAHWSEYTPQENMAIVEACEECWNRIDRLYKEKMEEIA